MAFQYPADFMKVIEFHGHVCPGLASGYRLAKAALTALGYESPEDGDLVTLAETDRCTIDAFQIILQCTVGKGKLYMQNTGKQAFTVGCRKSGKAVRVVLLPYNYSAANDELTRRVMSGRVSDEEYHQYKTAREQRIIEILTLPDAEQLRVYPVETVMPEKETIYNSPCCEFCGEQVMEPWTRLREGKTACIKCAVPVLR